MIATLIIILQTTIETRDLSEGTVDAYIVDKDDVK